MIPLLPNLNQDAVDGIGRTQPQHLIANAGNTVEQSGGEDLGDTLVQTEVV